MECLEHQDLVDPLEDRVCLEDLEIQDYQGRMDVRVRNILKMI